MPDTLPEFLIAGFAKCGTTSLAEYLRGHNQVFIPEVKEPRFLTFDLLKDDGYRGPGDHRPREIAVKDRESYLSLFRPGRVNGDASTDTAYYYEQTIPIIQNELGTPKIIVMLRDPVKRAISAYSHLIREQRETLSLEAALDAENQRIEDGFECIWSYLGGGMYARSVTRFRECFPQVKVIIFEEFIRSPSRHVREALQFLEVDSNLEFTPDRHNASGRPRVKWINRLLTRDSAAKRSLKRILPRNLLLNVKNRVQKFNLQPIAISAEIKVRMFKTFESDIAELEDHLERKLDCWKKY